MSHSKTLERVSDEDDYHELNIYKIIIIFQDFVEVDENFKNS